MSAVRRIIGAIAVVGTLALPAALGREGAVDEPGRSVTVENVDGEFLCTIVVQDEGLRRVLDELCSALAIDLEGFDGTKRAALVTADLRQQPLDRALEFVLGSVGLRGRLRTGALVVSEDGFDSATRAELLRFAAASYLQAHAAHPDHALAPHARVQQGRIEEERGNWNAALEHYQVVAEDYATSPVMAEALYRSGLIHERLSQWGTASLVFRQLINLDVSHSYAGRGRGELARCLVRLGDYATALGALDLLDDRYPADTARERLERRLLRAETMLGRGEHVECLRILERLESSGLASEERLAAQALRARAFEGLEMPSEAARAWILHARGTTGSDHANAIERAIQLALAEDDELGVLFAVSQARTSELRRELAPYEARARAQLGLVAALSPDELSIKEKLDLADEESTSGDPERVMQLLEPLFAGRGALAGDLRVRLVGLWASALHALSGAEEALAFLREERAATADPAELRRLDVLAAGLLEGDGRFDDAVRAYEGSYP